MTLLINFIKIEVNIKVETNIKIKAEMIKKSDLFSIGTILTNQLSKLDAKKKDRTKPVNDKTSLIIPRYRP